MLKVGIARPSDAPLADKDEAFVRNKISPSARTMREKLSTRRSSESCNTTAMAHADPDEDKGRKKNRSAHLSDSNGSAINIYLIYCNYTYYVKGRGSMLKVV